MRRHGPGLRLAALGGALLCLAALGACGKKGDLRPLPGEYEAFTWPKQYPAPETVVPSDLEPEEEAFEPVTAAPLPGAFRQPDALPGRDPTRTTTTIYRTQ